MLELREVLRRFGERTAVDGVSFTVEAGAMTGFVGGNGAGKTTTMRMVMGVLATHGGEIRWHGAPVTAEDRRGFGYMPEERGLYPRQSLAAQLGYLGRLRGLDARAAKTAAGELLERLDLGDRAGDKLESLSLGNQQRVQIAAALIGDPELLVLDEPFSGLDPHAVDTMADLLRSLTERGVPVLFSSHQLELVERLCDRLVILAGGRVVAQGSAAELRERGTVRHRLVAEGSLEWVRGLDGVTVVGTEPGAVLVEAASQEAASALLTEAVGRGPVREFVRVVPSVADVFREVTA
ncbi:ABC transporter ATP-binding protein (plasmid) [Streptomyces sp. BI20]|uniref:ABC transporter ATP-binding protein n=1 Tax=Streptomyces sp. BI20 TaxID=3403460 RepID=UPI003C763108